MPHRCGQVAARTTSLATPPPPLLGASPINRPHRALPPCGQPPSGTAMGPWLRLGGHHRVMPWGPSASTWVAAAGGHRRWARLPSRDWAGGRLCFSSSASVDRKLDRGGKGIWLGAPMDVPKDSFSCFFRLFLIRNRVALLRRLPTLHC